MGAAPALFILAPLVLSCACFGYAAAWVIPFAAAFLCVGLMAIEAALTRRHERGGLTAVSCAVLMLTVCCSVWCVRVMYAPTAKTASRVSVSGVVTLSRDWGVTRMNVIDTPQGKFCMRSQERYRLGQTLDVKGYLTPLTYMRTAPAGKTNKDPNFSFFYWKARDVHSELLPYSVKTSTNQVFNFHAYRQFLHEYFAKFPPSMRGYLDAMWTGLRDDELAKRHRRWGTSHLLAVSGFHVGLVVLTALWLLRRVKRRSKYILLSVLMWTYVFAAGAAPSAMRAALMFQITLLGYITARSSIALNSVAIAGIILLLDSPFMFHDVGWQLSMTAALTVTATASLADKSTWLWVPPAVFATTYPIAASAFEAVPLAGIPINFFAVPFFTLLFPVMTLSAATGLFGSAVELILRVYSRLADMTADILPWSVLMTPWVAWPCAAILVWLVARAAITKTEHMQKGYGTSETY